MDIDKLVQVRKHLHQNPELSTQEHQTQQYLFEQLSSLNYHKLEKVGGTGLLITFKGREEGKSILLRADIDALPIQEVNTFPHKSNTDGVSHKCGHDGHAAIMLGVAQYFSENPINKGELYLIFQPAEENGKGAKAILEDPKFSGVKPHKAYAFHNLPGFALNQVVCKKRTFTAAAKSVILRLKGKTSHAAEPEKGINPGLAVSEILMLSEELSEKDITKDDFALITIVHVNLGEKAYGVSAGYAEVHLTLRSWKNDVMQQLETHLLKRVEEITARHKLELEDEWLEIFHANENDNEAYAVIKEAAEKNKLSFTEKKEPFKWGEDFGLYTEKFSGAMFGIGSGENTPALHNPDYDFPDEIIETGVKMFTEIALKSL